MMLAQIMLAALGSEVLIGKSPMVMMRSITILMSTCVMKRTTTISWKTTMLPGDFPLKLQIIIILSSTHDNKGHQVSVEEDVAAALNIEDILIRMSLPGTMAKAMKGLLVMAVIGLDMGLWRMVMTRSNSRKVIRYIDNTRVKAMVSEGLSSERGAQLLSVRNITPCFW